MMQEIRLSHLANAALAKGGPDQMTPADNGRAGQAIREQYDYLNKFAQQVASGKQKLDGTLTRRAQMYAEAGRDTYEATVWAEMKKRGLTLVRSVLHAKDSCTTNGKSTSGCIEEARKGFVPIDAKPPAGITRIGGRTCRTNCRCSLEFATDTGETTG